MADRYEPGSFESKWRKRWNDAELFKTRETEGAPKFYGLDFFPYPSGAGLSLGHCRNYVPTDVLCRMKTMQGFNVLHPMGFDAFGLPAENEAIKRQTHPAPMIERYANRYQEQMTQLGISYDWDRSFKSSDPDYYKWTQWIFELLYKKGLAYRKLAAVNWDPVDKTVLADEEVIAGRAERSGALVEKRYIPQWFFKITDYAQRLIDDLDTVDWPDGIKNQQRNWIGRSEGVQFKMFITFDPPAETTPTPLAASSSDELAELEREVRASGFTPQPDPAAVLELKARQQRLSSATKGVFDLDIDPLEAAMAKMGHQTGPNRKLEFEVFTTRIDTVFGMTFCVLAPEHPLVDEFLPYVDAQVQSAVHDYRQVARTLSEADRQTATREKTGVFSGVYAINPANGKRVPIWIADYVLATYGTGAIMAVPAHDQRDFDFAIKFGLDITPVIKPSDEYLKAQGLDLETYAATIRSIPEVFDSKDSTLINSGEYSGRTVPQAQAEIGLWVEGLGIGNRKIQYKLRDWLISRQRYWGCPIPVIHSKDDELQLAPLSSLPVELPWVENYEPSGDGTSPLAQISEFVNVTDLDGKLGKRETDTMGGFACSSWYFLRFCDPFNEEKPWSIDQAKYWMPVDCYVGGAEHAVMHLLYARFWTKVLFDEGLVSVKEPFSTLRNQGQVLALTPYRYPREGEQLSVGEDGILIGFEEAKTLDPAELFYRWARMSKSKGNVVSPEEAIEASGADALRLCLLFRAPFEADIEWDSKGMDDLAKFLSRAFRLIEAAMPIYDSNWKDSIDFQEATDVSRKIRRATHQTIRNVTTDIERFALNTYVSWLMKFINELNPLVLKPRGDAEGVVNRKPAEALALSEAVDALILLLAPGAPHSADELWESTGHIGFTYDAPWPKFNPDLAVEDKITIAVQVNGKLRDTFETDAQASNQHVEQLARQLAKVESAIEGKTVRKVIVVPGKLVNLVVS